MKEILLTRSLSCYAISSFCTNFSINRRIKISIPVFWNPIISHCSSHLLIFLCFSFSFPLFLYSFVTCEHISYAWSCNSVTVIKAMAVVYQYVLRTFPM
jgi:hypothetical protein